MGFFTMWELGQVLRGTAVSPWPSRGVPEGYLPVQSSFFKTLTAALRQWP
jgi:hypothetical protein